MKNFLEFCSVMATSGGDISMLNSIAKNIVKSPRFPDGSANWHQIKNYLQCSRWTPMHVDVAHDLWKSWIIVREWVAPIF